MAVDRAFALELKAKLADADLRRHVVESRVRELKAEVKAIRVAIDRVVEEYKKSKNFKEEVTEGCIDSLYLGFWECKKKVAQIYLGLDLKDVVESNDEREEGEEEAKIATKVSVEAKVAVEIKSKQIGLEEIAPELTTEEEIAMEEAPIEAIVDTKVVVTEVAEDFCVV